MKYSINGQADQEFAVPGLKGQPNIAIIQPGSWGDNINSTLMLKPLKTKYPLAQIDIYTTRSYYSAFDNNPFVSNLIVAEATGKNTCLNFVNIYPELLERKGYQHIINASPFINPGCWSSSKYPSLGENLILSWARALDKLEIEYDLPLETVMVLRQDEIDKVTRYLDALDIHAKSAFKLLMEVEGESGQSFWNPQWTHEVCEMLARDHKTTIFISKREQDPTISHLMKQFPGRIYFVGHLSIRECAELYNKCNGFLSISSGLSNACNTNWCNKTNKWIEVVNSEACSSMPIRREGKVFWHKNDLNEFKRILPELLNEKGI